MVYRAEKQIVTRIHLSHSGFEFAVAKISKKFGFGKFFYAVQRIYCIKSAFINNPLITRANK